MNTKEPKELLAVLLEAKKYAADCDIFYDLGCEKECELIKEKFLLIAKESEIHLVMEIEGRSLRLKFPDEELKQEAILAEKARKHAAEIEEINNETELLVENLLEEMEEMVRGNSQEKMMERGLKAIKNLQKMER